MLGKQLRRQETQEGAVLPLSGKLRSGTAEGPVVEVGDPGWGLLVWVTSSVVTRDT